jgi:hypothetical protein
MSTSPRPARWAERASLALLAAGALLYGAAYAQMRRLEEGASVVPPGAKVLFAGLSAHARYARWAEAGQALVAMGLVAAVGATVWTARARRRAAMPRPEAAA